MFVLQSFPHEHFIYFQRCSDGSSVSVMSICETAKRECEVLFLQATPLPFIWVWGLLFGPEFWVETVGFPKVNKQCYHLLHELAHELAPVTPRFCGFVLCCCVLFCVGGFAFGFGVWFFVWFVWWWLRDGLLDCTQVLYQFTLAAPQSADGHVYALINPWNLICNMQLNVLNDLAEAMKALGGKKPDGGSLYALIS